MKITRKIAAEKLGSYLHHELDLDSLVDWAESAMMDAEFEQEHMEEVREVVARLGVADVRAFGLTWEDCKKLLKKLGYSASIKISAA